MNGFGFVRISCVSAKTSVASPAANADEMIRALDGLRDRDIVLFPELGVTGYTCADLFGQETLLQATVEALGRIAAETRGRRQLVVVGLPLAVGNSLYNCAAVLHDSAVLGVVPKQFLPTYKEFYDARWFRAGRGDEPPAIDLLGQSVPFGTDLLFEGPAGALVGVEICEDLWMPIPPSSYQALAGANVLLNLSASNETIGKSAYRRDLIAGQSGRCIAAYAYACSGPSESTTDLVFSGHSLIAENGHLLAECRLIGDGAPSPLETAIITADVDLAKLANDRRATTSFASDSRPRPSFRRIRFALDETMPGLIRDVPGMPFVPVQDAELDRRCADIFGIQCAGLARRIERLPRSTALNIGTSGGLDSTLGLLVAVKTCDLLGRDRRTVHALTMPGFGTTQRTLTNALALMDHLGVTSATIDIRALALQTFQEMGHRPFGLDVAGLDVESFQVALASLPSSRLASDLIFENVQARLRTFLLMSRGFVVGTGDLSELALGWCTYNGDHMSMYNPNCSIPKTLVRFLVRYVAEREFGPGPARDTLRSIVATTISPELLPVATDGDIGHATEDVIGPYELHDFFLYHLVRCGYSPEKILFLTQFATFSRPYGGPEIVRTLKVFLRRFFNNQFKRSCVPDGPKVGTVSLSPRGDWRMPSDADSQAWLDSLAKVSSL